MSGMTAMQKVYFICAWIIAGLALIATILLGVGWDRTLGAGMSMEVLFLGITGCVSMLYLSGFFTNQIAIFITAIGVGCLSLFSLILQIFGSRICVGGWGCNWILDGTTIAGNVFLTLFLGLFCTLLLIRLSGKFGE
jgi:hypothetical protein